MSRDFGNCVTLHSGRPEAKSLSAQTARDFPASLHSLSLRLQEPLNIHHALLLQPQLLQR